MSQPQQQIATVEEQRTAAPALAQSETGAVLSMIERMARDESVDLSRLERLMEMHERVAARQAKQVYAEALAAMQAEMPVIAERGAIRHGENKPVIARYALWEDVVQQITPVMRKHGFAITFRIGRQNERIQVTGVLTHRGGHSEETTMDLPVDTGPGRNAVQAIGSSTSYGKRYAAGALLNFVSGLERDDDGAAGGGDAVISDEQAEEIRALLMKHSIDPTKLLRVVGAESVPDIPASRYAEVISSIHTTVENRARRQEGR